ncbi:MAG TPA: pyruvate ferredoxin oxidoreductase [Firmicutes bacterium]|jgi:2-oxoacid:acceptor oxidoreductase gamma subunit (pyruvate/2-ketoisovalerate family)|uniref:Pyruvate ferredoxin oxidoreductase n=1 Tax=candidate division TA06 bacterium TaxID=2250710 RepID=A0A660S429_UNCT6|nr:2-oxoacid:acceptor oxidoreductase family protein [candidate division WOR-3 bacterium]RKX64253.1 MAG: pyruvate ferredoxin oxidoreductase [candidate division TA06 bacterium]HFD05252.1 pyruvate ferredoxin oxidoreductase [Bacillota bacterium]
MIEILIHGRGGQGGVKASLALASAASKAGKYVQSFPEFGVERRGAPIKAFTRISDDPIVVRSKIYNPDHVVVLDPTLLHSIDVTEGLKEGGWIIINTEKSPDSFTEFAKRFKVATVNATKIAVDNNLGSKAAPIVNTAILGAIIRVLNVASKEDLEKGIKEFVPVKAEANIKAAYEAYDQVKLGKEA